MASKKKQVESEVAVKGFQALLDSDLIKRLRKQHGKSIISRASDVDDLISRRIPTGSFTLDYGLTGGFACGRVTIMYGPKSSSKTSTGLRAIGNAQKMCSNCWSWYIHPVTGEAGCKCGDYHETVCAFVNVEQHWNKSWARRLGVDPDFMIYTQPDYGEQAIDVAEALLASGSVHVLFLDSLAFMVPTAEVDKSASDGMMGDHPRLISRAMRKFLSAVGRCEREHGFRPTLLMTNQISYKIGVMFGNPETTPGGQRPGFLAATEMRLWPDKFRGGDASGGAEEVGMKFRVTKQKAGIPHKEGEYTLILQDRPEANKHKGDIYDEPFLIKKCMELGLVEKVGMKWCCEGKEFPRKDELERELLFNRAFCWELKDKALKQLLAREMESEF